MSCKSKNTDIAVRNRNHLTATGNHMPYAQSLYSFRRHLKTLLFQRSFPDVIVTLVDLAIVFSIKATIKISD